VHCQATDLGGAAQARAPLEGQGMWSWYRAIGGRQLWPRFAEPGAPLRRGQHTFFIKTRTGASNYWGLVLGAARSGPAPNCLRACAWQYLYGNQPEGGGGSWAKAVGERGADWPLIDADAEYEGIRTRRRQKLQIAELLSQHLR